MQHNPPPPQAARLRRPLERALLRDPSMIPDSPLPRLTFLILQVIQCVCVALQSLFLIQSVFQEPLSLPP